MIIMWMIIPPYTIINMIIIWIFSAQGSRGLLGGVGLIMTAFIMAVAAESIPWSAWRVVRLIASIMAIIIMCITASAAEHTMICLEKSAGS